MNQIDPVIFEFSCNDGAIRLLSLGVLSIKNDVLSLDKSFLLQGHFKTFGIFV